MSMQYNAPVILTFTLISTAILFLDQLLGSALIQRFFAVYSTFNSASFLDYFRLFTYIFGHKNWTHLMGNFLFILLIGPIVEGKYQSGPMLLMILITALITGLLKFLSLPMSSEEFAAVFSDSFLPKKGELRRLLKNA